MTSTDPLSTTIAALTTAQRRVVYYAAPNGLEAKQVDDGCGGQRTEFRALMPHAAASFSYSLIYDLARDACDGDGNRARPALLVLRKDGRGVPTWAELTELGRAVAKVLARERWERAAEEAMRP